MKASNLTYIILTTAAAAVINIIGVALGHITILSLFQAVDPENDPVTYSIMSGNDLRQFAIGDKTGVITVIRKLDREDLTRYQLVCTVNEAYYFLLFNITGTLFKVAFFLFTVNLTFTVSYMRKCNSYKYS
jgi:hypothetical protein